MVGVAAEGVESAAEGETEGRRCEEDCEYEDFASRHIRGVGGVAGCDVAE